MFVYFLVMAFPFEDIPKSDVFVVSSPSASRTNGVIWPDIGFVCSIS